MVDGQHQDLVRMVNELHDAIVSNTHKTIMAPMLDKLTRYTLQHFTAEEGLMARVKYPGLAAHRRKHEDLARQAKDIVEQYRSGKLVLSITLSTFLADWLRHHIKEDDMAVVRFIRSAAGATEPAGVAAPAIPR
jgi:hemerythrin-like metal-binding protein